MSFLKKLENMTVSNKIIGGYAVVLALMLIAVTTGFYSLSIVQNSYNEFIDVDEELIKDSKELRFEVRDQIAHYRALILYPEEEKVYLDDLQEDFRQSDSILKRMQNYLRNEEMHKGRIEERLSLLDEISNLQVKHKQALEKATSLEQKGNRTEAISLGIAEIRPLSHELVDKAERFAELEMESVAQARADNTQNASRLFLAMASVSILALILGLVLGLLITRSVTRQLRDREAERDHAEGQLRAASLYARSLIEASLDPLVTISKDGKITDVNKATEQVAGISRERLAGSDFSDYFTEPEKAREGYQEVFSRGFVRDYPLAIRHSSGKVIDVFYNAVVYKNEAGEVQGVFAAARDVTERKVAEEKLRAASFYARGLIEASLDPQVTISKDGKITDVNKATEQVTGVTRERLVGSDFSDYFTEPEKAREGYQQVFSRGFVRDYPLAIRHSSGKVTDVLYNAVVYKNEAGEVQGVFAAARDVTERKVVEEKLRSASLYARGLIEASLDPLVTISKDGKITDVNKATEQVAGVPRERLVGSDFSDYFTEPEKAKEGYQQVFSRGFVRDYPLAIRHSSGKVTDVLYNAVVYKNEAGEVQGVFAAARDIPEHKKMKEKLMEQAHEIMEAVNILSSSASEILASTTQLASSTSETASIVSETTTTSEEVKQTAQLSSEKARNVSESAQKTASVAQQGKTAVAETVDGINRIKEQTELVAESIVRLSEQNQAIGDIITTVNDLAEQSNLLAVNAAIEAAKAGEYGKGFAVVAGEIKSLAEQSKQATAQVRAILSDIQKATNAAVMATEKVSKAVEAGVKQATEAGESIKKLADSITDAVQVATQIAASSQQQLVGMNQMVSAMESIKQATQQNLAGTKQTEKAAHDLNELGEKLKAMVEESKI